MREVFTVMVQVVAGLSHSGIDLRSGGEIEVHVDLEVGGSGRDV